MMAKFSAAGLQAGNARTGEYLGDINEANQWNQMMENIQKTGQHRLKKQQATEAKNLLQSYQDDPNIDPAEKRAYQLSALGIVPELGEGVDTSKIAAFPIAIEKQKLYAQALKDRLLNADRVATIKEANEDYDTETKDIVQDLSPETLASTLFPEEYAQVMAEAKTAVTEADKIASRAKAAALVQKAAQVAPTRESQMLALRASRRGERIPLGIEGANFATALPPGGGFGVTAPMGNSELLLGAPDPSQLRGNPALQPPRQSAMPSSAGFGYDTSGDSSAPWPY